MSLLSVTVKKARYVGIQGIQFNTYVTLKLQNVKSTTVTVKGPTPCWEQDFLFEINDINLGLLVEVWNKGVIWDRALGYHYLPLTSVAYNEDCSSRWVELEAQLMMRGGAVVGTTGPTGHALLLDCRFEPPFDAEGAGGADLQRKLDLLNGALDAERAEQARRQMQYIAHSGYSEDSDYTSDLNYPVGQHPNCSASQFRTAAHQIHTPQRSLEVSRENSYERDEYHMHADIEPLYYNSQPRTNRMECWSQYQPELRQASIESAVSWRTAADWHSTEEQRRPSLERQNTLYDDLGYGYDAYTGTHIGDHTQLSQQQSYEEYYDTSSVYHSSYVGGWGGYDIPPYDQYENALNKRRSSVVQLPQVPNKQLPASSRYSDFNGMAPYRPRTRRTAASLPATPSSTPKRGRALPTPPGADSASSRGPRRRLPRAPYPPPHHVPYTTEPEKTILDTGSAFDSYGYQHKYEATADHHDTTNYTSFDEDGMQPFFDETPHATPPATAQKLPWSNAETTNQFIYTTEDEQLMSKSLPTTTYLPQMPIMNQQKYEESMYPNDDQYSIQPLPQHGYQQEQQFNSYQEHDFQQDHNFITKENYEHLNYPQQENYKYLENIQKPYDFQQKQNCQQQNLQYQQQVPQQQKQSSQQLQSTMMTGAATLGSMFAGGAKKLGSLFGAAAAAVAPPSIMQPPTSATNTSITSVIPYTSTVAPVTSFTTATTVPITTALPEVSSAAPVSEVTSTVPVALPRTPSLRRQESIQRPSVRRTRTLPEAPDDMIPTDYDESAYDEEYHKTEYDEHRDHDRTSLDKYHKDEFVSETIQEESIDNRISEEISTSIQKVASPTRNTSITRKPSTDSYSSAQTIPERKISQGSYHQDDKLSVPTTQEEVSGEKNKVTFQDERTTYHEVSEERDRFHDIQESFDEQQETYHDDVTTYSQEDERFAENEKFDQEQFQEAEETYHEDDTVFQESQSRRKEEHVTFQEGQPKLTPRQRWHRAYNKIVMQLNVSMRQLKNMINMLFSCLREDTLRNSEKPVKALVEVCYLFS